MTPVSTIGNLCGSRMESVMGTTCERLQRLSGDNTASVLTRPIPSKENTAVLLGKGKCMGLPH
jgi:hypothetical protein